MNRASAAAEPPATSGFTVSSRRVGASVVLAVVGELDLDSAPALTSELTAALGEPEIELIVVDCEGMSFCDSTGLNALLAARLRAEGQGSAIRLAAVPTATSRMFGITGADTVFQVYPDVESALGAA
ncbi:STAS domain-containing protein [Streptacidiphilus sp. P02-A3a]|uniref:STAS domain-containing protein n=1 Tax=Streptacidiphilus sp. P02-A3a TaxID=2704468 RepID=UPI0015FDB9F4|nr:STAS domain-containing protein [Streptacidiphilus sp. P02-A3a]QMU70560.1 STAS domain-containing protein [Streptacidiphilus sp. P02-A3a]